MIRALIDTNIVLDYLLEREPFAEIASQVMDAQQAGRFQAYVCAITPLNVFYIARKFLGRKEARHYAESLLERFEICTLDKDILLQAKRLKMVDFEDAAQAVCAKRDELDFIVTRDLKDYANSPIRAVAPADFVRELA
jgi:predicted nucleic acid-binding protein